MNEQLIKECEPLIKSIAKKFYNLDYNDLYQAGIIGLINAYKHYKNNKETKFSTFAYQYIFGEMYNLSISNNLLHQNRDCIKLLKLVEKTKQLLTQSLKKEPSIKEISQYLSIPESSIDMAIKSATSVLSLDSSNNEETNLYYNIPAKKQSPDLKIDLTDSLKKLTTDEQKIIYCRYFNDLTQQQTASKLGLSQVKVSRYEKRSLTKMYNYLNN